MPPYNDFEDVGGPPRTIGGPVIDSFHAKHNLGGAPRLHPRPAADIPSASSSGSWVGQAFPHSHPRRQPQQMTSNASIVSGSVHPHIRELVERQQQQQQQQQRNQYVEQQHPHHVQQHREHERRLQENQMRQRGMLGANEGVVHGLNMQHVVNQNYGGGAYTDDHTIKTMKSHRPPGYNPNPTLGASLQRNPADGEDYVIEGAFQNKGCVNQTADDVGYLFGCGTKPQDEVVYVYNTQPEPPKAPPTAAANEQNLFYHRGPDDNNSIHDVMFQIDREYQAMQQGEFLRDPPPGTSPRSPSGPPRGHYNVVHEDDDHTHAASCSLSSLMDLILPGRRAKRRRESRKVFDPFHGAPQVSSSGSFDKAKAAAAELQSQLKAMVSERARKQVSKDNAPMDETRQEPTPPASPSRKTEGSVKEKEVEGLRKEQAHLDQARRALEVELAAHRQNVAAMNQNMRGGMSVGGMGGMAVSPTALGVQAPMLLSPLTAPASVATPMMGMPTVQPMMNVNGGFWPQQQQQMPAMNIMPGNQVQLQPQGQDAHTIAQSTLASARPPLEVNTSHMHHDATSVMGKSMMSHTIGTATYGGRGQGKFIDNVGYGMSKGPTTPSQARSPRRSPRSKHASGGASTTSYARSNARMEDLQAKNAVMRQDIARMKECMDGGSVSPSRRGRPFPRTSPHTGEGPLQRAMRRSDEARSVRGGGASVVSGSPKRYDGHSQRYASGRRREPPNPMRTRRE